MIVTDPARLAPRLRLQPALDHEALRLVVHSALPEVARAAEVIDRALPADGHPDDRYWNVVAREVCTVVMWLASHGVNEDDALYLAASGLGVGYDDCRMASVCWATVAG